MKEGPGPVFFGDSAMLRRWRLADGGGGGGPGPSNRPGSDAGGTQGRAPMASSGGGGPGPVDRPGMNGGGPQVRVPTGQEELPEGVDFERQSEP